MKNWMILVWVAAVAFCVFYTAGCEKEEPAAEIPVQKVSEPVVVEGTILEEKVKAPDRSAVTVNGQKIMASEIAEELNKRIAAMKKRMPAGQEMPDAQLKQMHMRLTDSLVEEALIKQIAKEKDVAVTEEQVLSEIAKIAGMKNQSMEEVEKEIANWGMTMEDLKGQVHTQMLGRAVMEKEMNGFEVSDEEVKKFYDENPQHFESKEQVKASHILCGKRGITPEEYPAELEKIKAAQARLNAGEAFEDVAKDISTCPSSAKGGDLGFFGKGRMDPAFEKTAFELEVGKTSDIVKTSFGYHLIKVTDKKEAGKTPLKEAKAQITPYLENTQKQQKWNDIRKTFREKAEIVYSAEEQMLRDEMEKVTQERNAAMMKQMMQRQAVQQQKQQETDKAKAEETKTETQSDSDKKVEISKSAKEKAAETVEEVAVEE